MIRPYHTIQATDGVDIFFFSDLPAKPQGIVVICHGYGGHSGQYDLLVNQLTTRGYGVYAYDHRGQGRSQTDRGHLQNFMDLVGDLHRVISHIEVHHPDLPIFTVGHSMGGLVSFLYGALYPTHLRGQIFSAPALGMPWGTSLIPDWAFNSIRNSLPRLKIYPLLKRTSCRDKAFLRRSKSDPLTLKYSTAGFFCEFIHRGVQLAQEHVHSYRLPCLLLHGKQDKIIPYGASLEVFDRLQVTDKTLKLYDHLYHELLQEPEKEVIYSEILDWLEHRAEAI